MSGNEWFLSLIKILH